MKRAKGEPKPYRLELHTIAPLGQYGRRARSIVMDARADIADALSLRAEQGVDDPGFEAAGLDKASYLLALQHAAKMVRTEKWPTLERQT